MAPTDNRTGKGGQRIYMVQENTPNININHSKNKLPWFKFIKADYVSTAVNLRGIERAIYIDLMRLFWEYGSLPNDMDKIRLKMLPLDRREYRWLPGVLDKCFAQTDDGRWFNPDFGDHHLNVGDQPVVSSTSAKVSQSVISDRKKVNEINTPDSRDKIRKERDEEVDNNYTNEQQPNNMAELETTKANEQLGASNHPHQESDPFHIENHRGATLNSDTKQAMTSALDSNIRNAKFADIEEPGTSNSDIGSGKFHTAHAGIAGNNGTMPNTNNATTPENDLTPPPNVVTPATVAEPEEPMSDEDAEILAELRKALAPKAIREPLTDAEWQIRRERALAKTRDDTNAEVEAIRALVQNYPAPPPNPTPKPTSDDAKTVTPPPTPNYPEIDPDPEFDAEMKKTLQTLVDKMDEVYYGKKRG